MEAISNSWVNKVIYVLHWLNLCWLLIFPVQSRDDKISVWWSAVSWWKLFSRHWVSVGSCDHGTPGSTHVSQLLQSKLTQRRMKFFKIFKKKSPTSTNQVSSNLVCNIHWAEVQRELTQGVKEMRPANNTNLNYHKTSFQRDQVNGFKDNNGWNSCDEENYSSGENSWSSVSLSSSSKTTSANQFPEENFSR